jgi:23S rRNA A2030 N6-methylase RlmJ
MNEELKNAVKIEFEKVWKNDEKMIDFCLKKITGIVRLADGGLFTFEKPTIETKFCFGYGLYGISTEEEDQGARHSCELAKKKKNFIAENMRFFNHIQECLNYDGTIYSTCHYPGSPNLLRNIDTDYTERRFGRPVFYKAGILSPEDIENLKTELENQKNLFRKCLETYWKRYGASKLKTWTYLVD